MTRDPIVGDVIKIKGKRQELLVIEAERKESKDTVRNESYYANTFTTIKMPDAHALTRPMADPKETLWQLPHASMNVGTPIDHDDIILVGQAKFKKQTTVTYTLTKVSD